MIVNKFISTGSHTDWKLWHKNVCQASRTQGSSVWRRVAPLCQYYEKEGNILRRWLTFTPVRPCTLRPLPTFISESHKYPIIVNDPIKLRKLLRCQTAAVLCQGGGRVVCHRPIWRRIPPGNILASMLIERGDGAAPPGSSPNRRVFPSTTLVIGNTLRLIPQCLATQCVKYSCSGRPSNASLSINSLLLLLPVTLSQ